MLTSNRFLLAAMTFTAIALMLTAAPRAAAQTVCADSVQGHIAWSGPKATTWTPANLTALCRGAETSTAPGTCFARVMSGTVNFGGGTSWNPSNALKLCAGALDANARVACFEGKIAKGIPWSAATDQCANSGLASVDFGAMSQSTGPIPKPGLPPVKLPPRTAPAPAGPTCSPTGDCDGDGVSLADGDCDDNDPSRYPGATEIADFWGHDEDCNESTFGSLDVDGDGFVDQRVCNGSNCSTDCDDTRPAVNPNAAELPNRRDDNCNGIVDDDLEGWWNPAQGR